MGQGTRRHDNAAHDGPEYQTLHPSLLIALTQ
jgi:hypothetical protein